MKVQELHDPAAWAEFTKENGGGILQSFELGELYSEVEEPCRYLVVRNDEGDLQLLAMVLRKPLAFGYSYYYCPEGPIVRGGDWSEPANVEALTTLNTYLRRRARRDHAVFAKIEPHVAQSAPMTKAFQTLSWRPSPVSLQAQHVAHVDISPSENDIWDNFKKNARYNIRYAEKQGVEVVRGQGPWELGMFSQLYHATAAEKNFSYRDKAYLEAFRQHLMEDRNLAEAYVAIHDGEPIAAAIVTYYGNESVYLYAGSSKRNQTLYGTYLIQWEAMKEAKRRGCTFYNMTGVAATADPEDAWAGLRRFKLKFGSEVVHLVGAHDAVYKPLLYQALSLGAKLRQLVRPGQTS